MTENRENGILVTWEYATVGAMWLGVILLLTMGTVRGSFTLESWGLALSAAAASGTVAVVVAHLVDKAKRCLVAAVGYQIRMNGHGDNPEVTGTQVVPMQRMHRRERLPLSTLD